MESQIIIGVLSLCGTLIGTIGGILASNKLTNYRIQQLEEKVNKHNNLIDRMYKAENDINIINEKIEEIDKKIK